MEDNHVVSEHTIAASDKIRSTRLLQNPQRPPLRTVDRIEPDNRTVDSDEGHGRTTAQERVSLHTNIPGLGMFLACRKGRTEVGAPCTAANIDAAPASVLEPIALNGDPRRASLALHAGAASAVGVTK